VLVPVVEELVVVVEDSSVGRSVEEHFELAEAECRFLAQLFHSDCHLGFELQIVRRRK
jgi:hypothetical protein